MGGVELTPEQAFIGEECEDDKTGYTTNTIAPKPETAKRGEGKRKERKKQEKHINVTPFNQTIGSWHGASLSLLEGAWWCARTAWVW